MSSNKLKLVYYPIHGRALPIRLAFAVSGIEYENVFIPFAEWTQKKQTIPGGVIPVLEVGDKVLGQSNAILNYVCGLAGLVPADPFQRAQVDEVLCSLEDYTSFISPSMREPDQEKKMAMRKDIAETKLPPVLNHLEEFVAKHGKNGFAIGDKLSAADFKLFQFFWWLKSGLLDGIPTTIFDPLPHLVAFYDTFANIPAVKHHLETFNK